MDHLCLTADKLSVEVVSDLVTHDSCGAVSLFVGTTRDNFKGKKVVRLEYEAYEPMALKSLKSLCADMREKWPDIYGIAIYHRLGEVRVGEASVVIAVSSAHRATSLAAVAHCIDRLKASVPLWKREVYEDGAVWKENEECGARPRSPEPIIDKSLVQITATNEELNRRIESFIERKREQVNLSNIHDFTRASGADAGAGEAASCARARAVFVKRNDSKGHLKVHRVNNEWGPQTVRQPAAPAPAPAAAPAAPAACPLPLGVRERVLAAESFLSLRSVSPDVYQRLRDVEDRIRCLEAVSPEYANFWRTSSREEGVGRPARSLDCRYGADDINKKIEELERHGATWNTLSN